MSMVELSPAQRISMIRESGTLLDKQDWPDIRLVLGQHQIATHSRYDDERDTKSSYVIHCIQDVHDDTLTALHTYLMEEAGGGQPGQSPWSSNRVRLFCSHLAEHKQLVGDVGQHLERYGIESFIAHDSIEPSKEWCDVIEAALADCDAMIVLVHPGFLESKWCNQEVGWVLGRKRHVLPLSYGIDPPGFLGKYQALPCHGLTPERTAHRILDWLSSIKALHSRLAPSLVDAFVNSSSWNFTRCVVPYLEQIGAVEDNDLARMEKAATDNIDVRQCIIEDQTGPEWVRQYVGARRSSTVDDPWANLPGTEPAF